jgi:hypothetical protein
MTLSPGRHAARTPGASIALTPSTTHGGHPRWRGGGAHLGGGERKPRSMGGGDEMKRCTEEAPGTAATLTC